MPFRPPRAFRRGEMARFPRPDRYTTGTGAPVDKELHSRQQPLRVIIEIRIGRSPFYRETEREGDEERAGRKKGVGPYGREPSESRARERTPRENDAVGQHNLFGRFCSPLCVRGYDREKEREKKNSYAPDDSLRIARAHRTAGEERGGLYVVYSRRRCRRATQERKAKGISLPFPLLSYPVGEPTYERPHFLAN